MSDSNDPVGLWLALSQSRDAASGAQHSTGRPALSELYRRHWAEIVRYIRSVSGQGPPDPEDAAQAAFTQFAALERPEEVENARAFLYRSARNFVIDQRRKDKVRARHQFSMVSGAETSDKIDAARVLEAKQRLNLLKGVLERMDPQRRDALLMLKLDELTYVQIAQRMGVSQTWAKKLARDALIECDRFIRHAEGE